MTLKNKSFIQALALISLLAILNACSQQAEKITPDSKDQVSPAAQPVEESPSQPELEESQSPSEIESESTLEDSMLEKVPAKKSIGQNNTSGESNSRLLKREKLKSFQSESGKGADAEIQATPEAEEDADTELQTEERGGTVITTNN